MSYTLIHTAEQIDHKLDLINENKNLLPYPYPVACITKLGEVGLEDVGDGSVLTTTTGTGTANRVILNTSILPAGEYTVGFSITDIAEQPKDKEGFMLTVVADGVIAAADAKMLSDGITNNFKLIAETVVEVYLYTPASFETGLLIKPQLEAGPEKTTWVPYMDKIGSYVDERFNSTNTKLRDVLAFMKLVDIVEVDE